MPARMEGSRKRCSMRELSARRTPIINAPMIVDALIMYMIVKRAMAYRKIWILIAVAAGPAFVQAQWLNHRTPGIPRTPDGKPNLSARTPRDSRWQAEPLRALADGRAPPEMLERLIPGATNGAGEEPLSQYFINILSDFKPEDGAPSARRRRFIPATRENLQQRIAALALSSGRHAVGGNGACSL